MTKIAQRFLVTCVRRLALGAGGLAVGFVLNMVAPAQPASAACSALPSNNGTAAFTVNVPSTGTYRFWAHVYSPSVGNNGFYLRIDTAYCQITVGDSSSIPVGQFSWVDYQNGTPASKIDVSLAAGNHSVTLAGLDPGVGVDKVMFLADTTCTPTGDGSNCGGSSATPTPTPTPGGSTPSPTVVVTPAPGATPAPGGGTPVSGVVTLPQGTGGVSRTYYVDGKPVTGNKLDTTQLADGTHTLEVVQKDANGKTTISDQKLVVNNHHKGWLAMVLDWIKQPLHGALVALGLVALSVAGWALWRFKLRPGHRLGPAQSGQSQVMPASDGPESTMVYPEDKGPSV